MLDQIMTNEEWAGLSAETRHKINMWSMSFTQDRDVVKPQPAPVHNNLPAAWDLVIADMMARDQFGLQKYGTHLQPFNGRDALIDLYQELLDAVVYLRLAIYERDNPKVSGI